MERERGKGPIWGENGVIGQKPVRKEKSLVKNTHAQ
jgi:hypothetical protein